MIVKELLIIVILMDRNVKNLHYKNVNYII